MASFSRSDEDLQMASELSHSTVIYIYTPQSISKCLIYWSEFTGMEENKYQIKLSLYMLLYMLKQILIMLMKSFCKADY